MPRPDTADAEILRLCLEQIRPAGMSFNAWFIGAGLSHSVLSNIKAGKQPGVFNLERLVRFAGYELPAFWALVEQRRRS